MIDTLLIYGVQILTDRGRALVMFYAVLTVDVGLHTVIKLHYETLIVLLVCRFHISTVLN